MEIGEGCSPKTALEIPGELCRHKEEPEKQNWQCRIGQQGEPGDLRRPTAKRLRTNMEEQGVVLPSAPAKRAGSWDLDKCTPRAHPYQTHHLIPKMHLPGKDVCVWLAKNAGNSQWQLTESTNYDTDDARNGMTLPFASSTCQWRQTSDPAEQERICNTMMDRTGKQLHQGSHTFIDYGEENALHATEETGYRGAVDQLLKIVNGQTLAHVRICGDCDGVLTS